METKLKFTITKKNIMKSLLVLIISICTLSCNLILGQKPMTVNKDIQTHRVRLKNLAFCQCQSRVDTNTLSLDDASAAGFIAYLAYKEEIIEDLRLFTIEWVKENGKKYKSYSNSPLTNMKCLDYYNSKELENFIQKRDNKIDKAILKKLSE